VPRPCPKTPPLGDTARAPGRTLHSYQLGLLPSSIGCSGACDWNTSSAITCPRGPPLSHRPALALMVLLKNLLLCREPLYGVAHWAHATIPPPWDSTPDRSPHSMMIASRAPWTNSSAATVVPLALTVATHAVKEFQVELDELHNDSTTVIFSGDYADAAQESRRRGQAPAGHYLGP